MERSARLLCEEARVVLCSLRGGPPAVARGELALELQDLRVLVRAHVLEQLQQQSQLHVEELDNQNDSNDVQVSGVEEEEKESIEQEYGIALSSSSALPNHHHHHHDAGPYARPFLAVVMDPRASGPHTLVALRALIRMWTAGALTPSASNSLTIGITTSSSSSLPTSFPVALEPLLRGILQCKFEQTDAGADEAVELAIADLLALLFQSMHTSTSTNAPLSRPPLLTTDAIIDAFHTVFVTRHTFCHSPALCFHLEDTLSSMVTSICQSMTPQQQSVLLREQAPTQIQTTMTAMTSICMVLEFLMTQLLQNPFHINHHQNNGSGSGGANGVSGGPGGRNGGGPGGGTTSPIVVEEPSALQEIQITHDSTRILCFKLIQIIITHTDWHTVVHLSSQHTTTINTSITTTNTSPMPSHEESKKEDEDKKDQKEQDNDGGAQEEQDQEPSQQSLPLPLSPSACAQQLLSMIQDDLCWTLLMTGQALWMTTDTAGSSSVSSPILVLPPPPLVLCELCITLSTLWNTTILRTAPSNYLLIVPFETIWTGFYQRALVLLRQRWIPMDSMSFADNVLLDAQVELILESLVDLLSVTTTTTKTNEQEEIISTCEVLFATYDCDLSKSDVLEQLLMELSKCCGAMMMTYDDDDDDNSMVVVDNMDNNNQNAPTTPAEKQPSKTSSPPYRPVPPHLKELCAEAILACCKTLFRTTDSLLNDSTTATMEDLVTTAAEAVAGLEQEKRSSLPMDLSLSSSMIDHSMVGQVLAQTLSGTATTTAAATASSPRLSHRTIKSRKRQFRKAAALFNQKASKGIEFMVQTGLIEETPAGVASFLRNGLVLGLDKAAVGQYLGELGKKTTPPTAAGIPSPTKATKIIPSWDRDDFHKQVLMEFCSCFKFQHQSLLDGLRMFLASFRLPGESQQIDRILQEFADSCGRQCDEAQHIFSSDPKRASDTAFLLAFSIIMLNTDQHNANIREDKKMSLDAFVRNNADYGRDITEPGKELPRDFLETIYRSIQEEEIRTLKEGAEGYMTPERWKDVLRGSNVSLSSSAELPKSDTTDIKELVMETIYIPILCAVGAFWNQPLLILPAKNTSNTNNTAAASGGSDSSSLHRSNSTHSFGKNNNASSIPANHHDLQHGGTMMGAQGARLGMDIALELMTGVRNVGRMDLFRDIFSSICNYTGLLGLYDTDAESRTIALCNSLEAQSAIIVVMRVALEAGNDLGSDGWMCVWAIILELRDLKMLSRGSRGRRSILMESDADLLKPARREDWRLKLARGCFDDEDEIDELPQDAPRSFLGGLGRALFGSDNPPPKREPSSRTTPSPAAPRVEKVYSVHGKDELFLWDDLAESDDEADDDMDDLPMLDSEDDKDKSPLSRFSTAGALFESQLIHENIMLYHQTDTPVTGLERVEDTRPYQVSPRARVRKRLAVSCDFSGLVSESRFMEHRGTVNMLDGLVKVVEASRSTGSSTDESSPGNSNDFALSPASEALAEVLLCEIAVKNKDRLTTLWVNALKKHYDQRLNALAVNQKEEHGISVTEPGTEKCISGLLRLCVCASQKEDIASETIATLSIVSTMEPTPREIEELDKHISEGIWRVCSNVDGLLNLNSEGWHHLLTLIKWCAARTGKSAEKAGDDERSIGLPDDDAGLQAYRSLHLMLHAPELKDYIPITLADAAGTLVEHTANVGCSKLSLATLDLLHLLQSRLASQVCDSSDKDTITSQWTHALNAISKSGGNRNVTVVRSHTLSILTDAFLDKQGSAVPPKVLRTVFPEVCIGFASARMASLIAVENQEQRTEDVMIEFEQCVSLIFKPFLHHAKAIVKSGDPRDLEIIWTALLKSMEDLLQAGEDEKPSPGKSNSPGRKSAPMSPGMLRRTLKDLASEHLRNAILVLHAHGVLLGEPGPLDALSIMTWETIGRMSFCKDTVNEWKMSATAN